MNTRGEFEIDELKFCINCKWFGIEENKKNVSDYWLHPEW